MATYITAGGPSQPLGLWRPLVLNVEVYSGFLEMGLAFTQGDTAQPTKKKRNQSAALLLLPPALLRSNNSRRGFL